MVQRGRRSKKNADVKCEQGLRFLVHAKKYIALTDCATFLSPWFSLSVLRVGDVLLRIRFH